MKISKYLIVASITFQVMSAFGATIDPKILAQMQADLKAALDGGLIPKVSDSMPWAGGTLVRQSATEFGYLNTKNGHYSATINASTDLVKLAKDDATINSQWVSQYGVDLAGAADTSQDQYNANRIAIDHVLQYGLSPLYTKEKPYVFNNGIAAFNDNGVVRYLLKNKVISQPDLLNTNEYKATVGANSVADKVVPAPVAAPTPPSSTSNLDYIASANASSIEMLIKAAKEYKIGNLAKDKFVQVALQVAGMADYSNNVAGDGGKNATRVPAPAAYKSYAGPDGTLLDYGNVYTNNSGEGPILHDGTNAPKGAQVYGYGSQINGGIVGKNRDELGKIMDPSLAWLPFNPNSHLNSNVGNTLANNAPEAAPLKILIGTGNNGRDEIYVYKLNSWDAKYGYKVLIVPHDPKSPNSHPYELLIPANANSASGHSNEAEYILSNIPKGFNVDKTTDNKPAVTLEEGVAGRWHLTNTEMTCVNDFETISQPSGNCKINATAKSSSGGWANDLKAEDKACIDKGFKKVAYTMQFICVADIFKNAGGQ